jgi:hypothetical protein
MTEPMTDASNVKALTLEEVDEIRNDTPPGSDDAMNWKNTRTHALIATIDALFREVEAWRADDDSIGGRADNVTLAEARRLRAENEGAGRG